MRITAFATTTFFLIIALFLVGCGGKVDLNGDLLKAVESGELSNVTSLLGKGANVNTTDDFDRTPLMMSALGGHSQIAQALIAAGADVDAIAKYGQTALRFAEEQGNTEIAGILKAAGARS